MAYRKGNHSVSFKCCDLSYKLIVKFSELTGYSISQIVQTIVDCYLPTEIEAYTNKLEVLNYEKTTKNAKS